VLISGFVIELSSSRLPMRYEYLMGEAISAHQWFRQCSSGALSSRLPMRYEAGERQSAAHQNMYRERLHVVASDDEAH